MTNSKSCPWAFTELAGVEALTGPQDGPAAMVEEFRARRELIVRGLNAIPGLSCREPHGAFYVFPNITGTGMSSREVADLLMQEAGEGACPRAPRRAARGRRSSVTTSPAPPASPPPLASTP